MSAFKVFPQETSNPKILKFEANQFLTQHDSFEYSNIDEAKDSPLAQQLFYLPFVKKVYISGNFVAIERYDIVDWEDVKVEVAKQIESYLNKGGEITREKPKTKEAKDALSSIGAEGKVLLVIDDTDTNTRKSFRNLTNAHVISPTQLNLSLIHI